MAILLKKHMIPDGVEPTITGMLGITPQRKNQLEYVVKMISERQSGSFMDDFQMLARECANNEEYTFAVFQYGVIIGTNLALQAASARMPKN